MKLFTYRGIRVRAFYRHIRGITWFIWCFPSLLAIRIYCYLHLEELKDHPLPQVYFIGNILIWIYVNILDTFWEKNLQICIIM